MIRFYHFMKEITTLLPAKTTWLPERASSPRLSQSLCSLTSGGEAFSSRMVPFFPTLLRFKLFSYMKCKLINICCFFFKLPCLKSRNTKYSCISYIPKRHGVWKGDSSAKDRAQHHCFLKLNQEIIAILFLQWHFTVPETFLYETWNGYHQLFPSIVLNISF